MQGWNYWKTCPHTGQQLYTRMNGHEVEFLKIVPTDEVFAENAQIRNASSAGNWGDGRSVAQMPLEVYLKEIKPAVEQGDKRHVERWMNNLDNQRYRTKRGRV